MADLAMLLHWRAADMDAMSLAELLDWHALAVERHNAMHTPPAK